jgi:glutamine cyclotransferase
MIRSLLLALVAPLMLLGASAPQPVALAPVQLLTARIVARYPHDTSAFTEGLIWSDGALS